MKASRQVVFEPIKYILGFKWRSGGVVAQPRQVRRPAEIKGEMMIIGPRRRRGCLARELAAVNKRTLTRVQVHTSRHKECDSERRKTTGLAS